MHASRVFTDRIETHHRRARGGAHEFRAFAAAVLLTVWLACPGHAAVPQGTEPAIEVDPPSLSVDVSAGDTLTANLGIANVGGGSLDWNVTDTDPGAFRRVGAIDLGGDGGIFKSALIDAAGHYAYFGTTVPGEIVKVDLVAGQPVGAITLPDGELQLWTALRDPAGTFGYFATNAAPAQLLKIDLATLDQVATTPLDGNVRAAVIDRSGAFAYFGTNTSPALVLKVDLATFQQVAAITLEDGENKLNSAVIDPAGQFAYFGTATSPGEVVKIDLSSFTRVGNLPLEDGENTLQSAVIDPSGAFAYFGTNTVPGQLVKIDLASFTRVGAAPAGADEGHFTAGVIDPTGTAAYFSTSAGPAVIVKFDLATFARAASVTLDDGENFVGAGVMDPSGNYAYFPATSDPATLVSHVVKLGLVGQNCALPSWASVDPTGGSVAAGESEAAGITFDASGENPGDYSATLCIASNDAAQPLVAVPLTMSVTPAGTPILSFDPGSLDFGDVDVGTTSPPQTATLHNTGTADASALAFSDPGAGFSVDSGDCGTALAAGASCAVSVSFAPQSLGPASATLEVGSAEGATATLGLSGNGVDSTQPPTIAVDPDSLAATLEQDQSTTEDLTIANLGGTTLDWSVTETAPPTFARVGALPFESGEDFPRSVVTDPSGQFAWFGTFTAPGRVVKVDLANFQRIGSTTLATGEDRLISAVRDPSAQFAYFGTSTSPGQIVKIDLATLDQVGAITLDDGEDAPAAAVIDPDGAFAYFATATTPGRLVKIDLSTFERVGAIAFDDGEDEPISGVIDPAGAHAWFGTTAGQVVEVDLASFARTRATTLSDDSLAAAAIDAGGDTAWFGGTNGVTRIDLASLTETGTALLGEDEYGLLSGVVDANSAYGYFATTAFPAQIVKIDLSMMLRVDGVALADGEDLPRAAVIDPAGRYAYFSATSFPGTPVTELVKIALAGPDCALPAWAGVDPPSGSVPAGASQDVGVSFDATSQEPGTYGATLCLASNDPSTPLITVPLDLTVTPSTAAPVLSFTPESIDFGDVEVGDTSPARTATLHNTGNASATGLVFGDLSGSGFAAATGSCGTVLSAGASCVVSVTFTPETLGPAAATLTVGSTEGASSALQLDGNGIPQTPPASIEVTPGSLAATLEPDQMQALDLSIANLGGEALDWQVDDRPGFRRVDRVDLAHVDYVTASAIDPSGHYAYFGGSNDNRGDMISKVDLSTFEEVADIETDGFDTGYTSAVVDPAGHYAYFGTYTVPGVIVKIDLDTFQQVASITLPSGDYFLDAAVMDPAGRYAYFFGYTSGKVIKLDLDAFAVVGTLTLPETASDAITAVIEPDGSYAYIGVFPLFSQPGQLLRLDLANFQLAGSVVMTENERPTSSVIDAQGRYVYLGTFGGEDGRAQVVKIDTDTFEQVDEITLDPGESDLTSAVIDPSGSFAYFGANTQPGRIVRIDLGTFERTGAITLQGPGEGDLYGEDYPQSAVIAPTGEYAYFGLATFPGRVARIHLPGPDCTLPPWLSVDPMDGTVAAGASGTASVGFDATGLAPGEYGATLCFDSNDPSTPQLPVPISLTVIPATPPDRIFSDGFDGTEP